MLHEEGAVAGAAYKLSAMLHGDLGRDPGAPLFICFMPERPDDPPLPL